MIVAFDVDYTLINGDNSPNYEVIDILRWFKRNGDRIIVWSGGGYDYATHWDQKLALFADITAAKNKQSSELFKPDVCFDDEIVELAKVNFLVVNPTKGSDTPYDRKCRKCKKPMLADVTAVIEGTNEWDGHTYKFSCECVDKNLRVSIG